MAYVARKTSRFFGDGGSLAEAREILRQRPSEYDPEIADIMIEMIACGEVLTDMCLDRDMPLPSTFYRWCAEDPRLDERYKDALMMGTDVTFDEALSSAYDSDTARGSVRWRAHMTRAERQMPEKYGPRATIRNTKEVEDEAGGIDYGAEIRRRLGAMADRMQSDTTPPNPTVSGT